MVGEAFGYTERVMWGNGTVGGEWSGSVPLGECIRLLEKQGAAELTAAPGWRVFESRPNASGKRDLIVLYIL